MTHLDPDALLAAAQRVTTKARVAAGGSGAMQILRIHVIDRNARIELWKFPRTYPRLECRSIASQQDRDLVRAVLDEIDRQVA